MHQACCKGREGGISPPCNGHVTSVVVASPNNIGCAEPLSQIYRGRFNSDSGDDILCFNQLWIYISTAHSNMNTSTSAHEGDLEVTLGCGLIGMGLSLMLLGFGLRENNISEYIDSLQRTT